MNIADYIKPVSGLEYFILMKDYGPRRPGKLAHGFEGIANPETTRREIISEVRDEIEAGRPIVHVKRIVGNDIEDVTEEIVIAALALKAQEDDESALADIANDRILARHDHARDLRKHQTAE